jgi:hypothetical protein
MIYTQINKFLLGTWVLRASNDKYFKDGYTTLKLNDDNTLKIKTIYEKGIFAEKKSISGDIHIISTTDNLTLLDITYSKYNIYSHSAFGIQIPEIKSKNRKFTIKKRFEAKIIDNSLLISDTKTPLYYLFDLQIGQNKSPYIEISLNTFIFSQIIGIFLNLFFMDIINSL